MKTSIIVAIANNCAIGKDNKLLCHLPADLTHFKQITTGKTVVMGLNTFRSLPNGALPNRRNIVISFEPTECKDCEVVTGIANALELCQNEDEIFIIGGASIYRQTIDIANSLYITWIHHSFEADTFFPEIDCNIWKETEREDFRADEKNKFDYSFVKYIRTNTLSSLRGTKQSQD
jgi:dihydrofolate reductase